MLTIWKFEFEVDSSAAVYMPVGAKVLSVGTQRPGNICVWAKVDEDATTEEKAVLYCWNWTIHRSVTGDCPVSWYGPRW